VKLNSFITVILFLFSAVVCADASKPVYIGFDGEYGLKNSTSAQSIEKGLQIAIDEINEKGGVLNGRPLKLVTRDNRSVPARAIDNVKELAEIEDLVAVVGERFSPVILSLIPMIHEQKIILMDAWGSADGITDHSYKPSFTFRVSLKDQHAMPTLLKHATAKNLEKVALLLPHSGWGRSNEAAAKRFWKDNKSPQLTKLIWYKWGGKNQDLARHYEDILTSGAQAIIFVANDIEGSLLVKYVASLPIERRIPIISHWGVTGGAFVESSAGALAQIDFSVIQTFSLLNAPANKVAEVMALMKFRYGITNPNEINSPVGFGHAYDIVHLLALAINQAGTTDRETVRNALENLPDHQGLVRNYQPAFSATSHDALTLDDVFMATYDEQGVIRPILPRP
jgi:branched-chain amino acid transport system substrate-binding protein